MAPRRIKLEYGLLNVSAHPHDKGIYKELLERVAGRRVRFRGDQKAAISSPYEEDSGILLGKILTWTELDNEAQILNTLKLEPASSDDVEKVAALPKHIGFNSRAYRYAFRQIDHLLVFESRNDAGEVLTPGLAERIFTLLFDMSAIPDMRFDVRRPDYVLVTTVFEDDALTKVFSVPHISTLEIFVEKPNADEQADDADSIIRKMEERRVRSEKRTLRAANPKEGIQPDPELKAQAAAATKFHGYVAAKGRDDDGNRISLSTREYPKTVVRYADAEFSTAGTILSVTAEIGRQDTGTANP